VVERGAGTCQTHRSEPAHDHPGSGNGVRSAAALIALLDGGAIDPDTSRAQRPSSDTEPAIVVPLQRNGRSEDRPLPFTLPYQLMTSQRVMSKYPPAEPGALGCEPLEAAVGVADAAPGSGAT